MSREFVDAVVAGDNISGEKHLRMQFPAKLEKP